MSLTPGEAVRFVVINIGSSSHTFTIKIGGTQLIDVVLRGGETGSTPVFIVPEAVPSIFYCRFHGQASGLGMAGRLFETGQEPTPTGGIVGGGGSSY